MGLFRPSILRSSAMKVAVIGAGFSGMLAAYLLEKKGVQVTVYEKENLIGGHCQTLTSKDMSVELATVFTFRDHIKELLVSLKVPYSQRFSYRNFLDAAFENTEHMTAEEVSLLADEMTQLSHLLDTYAPSLKTINYGYIHEDLLMSLSDFLRVNKLKRIHQVIEPHLSAYGYGPINEVQAYYAFRAFNMETLRTFVHGEKLLFLDKGCSDLIKQLGQNISDIRCSIEVTNIQPVAEGIRVETIFGHEYFDKVLITSKLPRGVIKDPLYDQMMKKIDTHPFVTCVYEVDQKNLVTTYYKAHLGHKNKIQFFHVSKKEKRTLVVAYAYGSLNKTMIQNISEDLKKSGVVIKHLMTARQWYIFPHLKAENLTPHYYEDLYLKQQTNHIYLMGSLICEPALSKLYVSVKNTVDEVINGPPVS